MLFILSEQGVPGSGICVKLGQFSIKIQNISQDKILFGNMVNPEKQETWLSNAVG